MMVHSLDANISFQFIHTSDCGSQHNTFMFGSDKYVHLHNEQKRKNNKNYYKVLEHRLRWLINELKGHYLYSSLYDGFGHFGANPNEMISNVYILRLNIRKLKL